MPARPAQLVQPHEQALVHSSFATDRHGIDVEPYTSRPAISCRSPSRADRWGARIPAARNRRMQFIRGALRKLRERPVAETAPYAFGRFARVRRVYGRSMGLAQRAGLVPRTRPVRLETLFPGLEPKALAAQMRERSAAFGLRLPEEVVSSLARAARSGTLRQWQTGRLFHAADVTDGRLPDGSAAVLADLHEASLLPEVQRVARDPLLIDTIGEYLGYVPMGYDPRILFSFAGDYSESERRFVGQTFEYHFDVHAYNFVYVNVYLVDVDEDAGAHVMVLGSHDDKPLRWLFGSAKRSDATIEIHYGQPRVLTIVGPAGTGFIQDSSCYHKILPPRRRDRIMLHIRYY